MALTAAWEEPDDGGLGSRALFPLALPGPVEAALLSRIVDAKAPVGSRAVESPRSRLREVIVAPAGPFLVLDGRIVADPMVAAAVVSSITTMEAMGSSVPGTTPVLLRPNRLGSEAAICSTQTSMRGERCKDIVKYACGSGPAW